MLSKEQLDRQDFEAWFVPIYHPRHMNRNNAGDYLFIDAEIAWTAWKARSAEVLSLREQLAELKALEPVAWRNRFTGYLHSNKPGIVDDCYDELFTSAKPAGGDNG